MPARLRLDSQTKGIHMNQQINDTKTAGKGRRWMMAAALVGAIGAAGVSYASDTQDMGFGMHGGHHGQMDPESMAKHVDKMVERIAPDATPQQKARLGEIAKSAFADLKPLREKMRDGHKRAHALLMAPTIDRVALERLRVEQMQNADALSKRILAAVEDAADVLTPEQRAKFAKHLEGRRHH